MAGGEDDGEEATRVGEDVVEGGGRLAGSMSLSGIGGDKMGRRVIRRRAKRSMALKRNIQLISVSAPHEAKRNILDGFEQDNTPPPALLREPPS